LGGRNRGEERAPEAEHRRRAREWGGASAGERERAGARGGVPSSGPRMGWSAGCRTGTSGRRRRSAVLGPADGLEHRWPNGGGQAGAGRRGGGSTVLTIIPFLNNKKEKNWYPAHTK
jgi:hypothetical protein